MHIHEDWNIDLIILHNLDRSTRKTHEVLFIRQVWQDSWAIKEILKSDTANLATVRKLQNFLTIVDFSDGNVLILGYLVKVWFQKNGFWIVARLSFGWHLNQQFTLPLFKIGCHVIFCLSSVLDRRPSIEMNFLGIFMVLENHFWSDETIITSFYEKITQKKLELRYQGYLSEVKKYEKVESLIFESVRKLALKRSFFSLTLQLVVLW